MNIAEIAQSVERCVEGAGVLGSIPSLGTTFPDGAIGRRAWLKPKLLRVRSPLGIPTRRSVGAIGRHLKLKPWVMRVRISH